MAKYVNRRPKVEIPESYAMQLVAAVDAAKKKHAYEELKLKAPDVSTLRSPTEKRPRTFGAVERVRRSLARAGIDFPPPVIVITDTIEYEFVELSRKLRQLGPKKFDAIRNAVRQMLDSRMPSSMAIMGLLQLYEAMLGTSARLGSDDGRQGYERDKDAVGRPGETPKGSKP